MWSKNVFLIHNRAYIQIIHLDLSKTLSNTKKIFISLVDVWLFESKFGWYHIKRTQITKIHLQCLQRRDENMASCLYPKCTFPDLHVSEHWFPEFGTDFHIKVGKNALNWLLSASISLPKGVSRIPDRGDFVYYWELSRKWCIRETCIREIDAVPRILKWPRVFVVGLCCRFG